MIDRDHIHPLAHAFVRGLRGRLTLGMLESIDAANEANPGDCATYDFLDPDEVMDEAFLLVMGRECEAGNEDDELLCNMAWCAVQLAGFAKVAREAGEA